MLYVSFILYMTRIHNIEGIIKEEKFIGILGRISFNFLPLLIPKLFTLVTNKIEISMMVNSYIWLK